MGYSYDQQGRLCCDICGLSGYVKKHPCPYGYCGPIALCPRCRHDKRHYLTKEYHREHGHCDVKAKEFHARERKEKSLLSAGFFVRRSALQHHLRTGIRIKVIFQGLNDRVRAFWMAPRTYRAIPLLEPATVENFRAKGKVTRARSTDIYDNEGRA